MTQIPDAPITQAAYARHRAAAGLPGATKVAVGRAVKSGRLSGSLVMVDGVARVRDVALADREWEANTDVSMRLRAQGFTTPAAALAALMPRAEPAPPTIDAPPTEEPEGTDPADFQAQRLKKERALASMAELKYREAALQLIPARDVERQLTGYLSSCKTRLLAIPSRAKQDLPHLTTTDLAVFERLVREALEERAGPADGE
jgi:hypothetical protein